VEFLETEGSAYPNPGTNAKNAFVPWFRRCSPSNRFTSLCDFLPAYPTAATHARFHAVWPISGIPLPGCRHAWLAVNILLPGLTAACIAWLSVDILQRTHL